jgi:mycothiol synthase
MRREDLADLPEPQLPQGLRIRRATAADAAGIAVVMAGAFEPDADAPVSAEAVMTRLFLHPIVRGVLVVVDQSEAVLATASVAYMPDRFGDVGYVHWVATDPAHAGLGLGRAVTAAVLAEFANLGLVAAVLETDDHRLPAVVSYTRLGFHPVLYERDHPVRWEQVHQAIAQHRA